jgi:hypothetical protein
MGPFLPCKKGEQLLQSLCGDSPVSLLYIKALMIIPVIMKPANHPEVATIFQYPKSAPKYIFLNTGFHFLCVIHMVESQP